MGSRRYDGYLNVNGLCHFATDESSKLMNNPHGSHPDRELLSLQAKSELILAAQDDLHKLAEESKEIQSLQRCAEIGGLKSKDPREVGLAIVDN